MSKGADEIAAGAEVTDRLRSVGAGAKPAVETQPGLLGALDGLVGPETRGSPTSSLRWTSKSTYELARELVGQGYRVSAELVRRLLHQMGYSLQAPAKEREGTTHPDRDGQFRYLNDLTAQRVAAGEPVISVDTKKKELIGDFHNTGREWQPKGNPERVRVHDIIDPALGRAIPYGIYDIANDDGWVSVGDTADTAEFAVSSIRSWWNQMGRDRFPDATGLLITADAGGSNGYRIRACVQQSSTGSPSTPSSSKPAPTPTGSPPHEPPKPEPRNDHPPSPHTPQVGPNQVDIPNLQRRQDQRR